MAWEALPDWVPAWGPGSVEEEEEEDSQCREGEGWWEED
jgi:hypothetical protein